MKSKQSTPFKKNQYDKYDMGKRLNVQKSDESTPDIPETAPQASAAGSSVASGKICRTFLSPKDGPAYQKLLQEHYRGFSKISLPQDLHEQYQRALIDLAQQNLYHYDVVQAGGKILSRTFVKRALVGEPGITYKYLGLRLFAHAWSGPFVHKYPALAAIRNMNDDMKEQTRRQMTQQYITEGSCDYNLTLINYMEPSSGKVPLRDEPLYNMGKVSVSWHADSSLAPNSSIAVYHCRTQLQQHRETWDWKVALRCHLREDLPAVVVPTEPRDVYFLLGDCNDTHQHLVLAGSRALRISSTHRVACSDMYATIYRRVKHAKKQLKRELKKDFGDNDFEELLESQRALSEVEFEWIAQYWVQGQRHHRQRLWWHAPMETLEGFWLSLEQLTRQWIRKRLLKCGGPDDDAAWTAFVRSFVEVLQTRQEQRQRWDERRAEKIYTKRMVPEAQPVERPVHPTDGSTLGKDLAQTLEELTSKYDL